MPIMKEYSLFIHKSIIMLTYFVSYWQKTRLLYSAFIKRSERTDIIAAFMSEIGIPIK